TRIDNLFERVIAAQNAMPRARNAALAFTGGAGLATAYPPSGWVTLATAALTAAGLNIATRLGVRADRREIAEHQAAALPYRSPRRPPEPPPRQGPDHQGQGH
ncbi:MAG: hypothetical protein ACRDTD_27860, partial [Pseudonocardiaceae bacterium]